MGKEKVIFICTNNSIRSQMAEGLLRSLHQDKYDVYSAGIKPTSVNPLATKVMKEIGIDISNHKSKNIEDFKDVDFDFVVTVCNNAKEACPFFPGNEIIHKDFFDPSAVDGEPGKILFAFRSVRDEIKNFIEKTFI